MMTGLGRRWALVARIGLVGAVVVAVTTTGAVVPGHADDPPPEPPAPRHFTMAFAGDVIPLPTIINRAASSPKPGTARPQ